MVESSRGGTRERIQQVALDLFAEQGYEQTSLREIADRLGVTKAALYYHFKTKEDILGSVLEDYLGEVNQLIDWARAQPSTAETRQEVIRRYAAVIDRRLSSMRFVQNDQAAMRKSEMGEKFRGVMGQLNDLLTPQATDLVSRTRALGAVVTLHAGILYLVTHTDFDPDEVRAAATQVAIEMITANG